MIAPLRNFIRDDVKFQWTPEYQQSFERVKAMLTEDIVMAYFEPTQDEAEDRRRARWNGSHHEAIRSGGQTLETTHVSLKNIYRH